MKNIQKITIIAFILGVLSFSGINSYAHCEIPCGIYGDSIRISLIKEHISTVEKSMLKIKELSASDNPDYNMLVRWVVNKEEHANKIQEIVSQYFLHQRVKFADPEDKAAYKKYQTQLELLHHILVFAMKSKQSTDVDIIEKLYDTVNDFEHVYFHEDDHGHSH